MKVLLTKTPDGKVTGFKIVPDRGDEVDVHEVNALRNALFFDSAGVQYDGREEGDDDCAGNLKFKIL